MKGSERGIAATAMIDRAKFFAAIRTSLFGGKLTASQVAGMEGLLDAFQAAGDGRPTTLAYGLATAFHETARTMQPVRETLGTSDAQVVARLDAWAAKSGRTSNIYWRRDPETGQCYYGRGFVQLTWRDNYLASSADAGVDLVANPDAALDPEIAGRILFIGLLDGRWNGQRKGLGAYLPGDPAGARRTVNGTDKAETIAGHYRLFLAAIEGAAVRDPVAEWLAAAPAPVDSIRAWLQAAPKGASL